MLLFSRRVIHRLTIGSLWIGSWIGYLPAQASVTETPGKTASVPRSVSIQIDGITLDQVQILGRSFATMKLEGIRGFEGIHYHPGHPALPVVRFYVDGEGQVSARFRSDRMLTATSAFPYAPAQDPIEKLPHPQRKFRADPDVYGADSFLKDRILNVVDIGTVRGIRRRLVTIYPVRYSPRAGTYEVIQDFDVALGGARLWTPQSEPRDGARTLAIVTPPIFERHADLERYIATRTAAGYGVVVIPYGRPAVQTPEALRAQLQLLLRSPSAPLTHVLILGDHEQVPAKGASAILGVTDHFYRAIDTDNYESDIGTPDVRVGRLSVRTPAELTTVLTKIEAYESLDESAPWRRQLSFVATSDSLYYPVAEGTHNHVISTHTEPADFRGSFPQEGIAGGDRLYYFAHGARGPHLTAALHAGRGIIDYSGHGSGTSWAGPDLSQATVRSIPLTSGALPFVIANACNTSMFTLPESIGETFLRQASGAIFYWGSYDSSYWEEDDILEKGMFDWIFTPGADPSFGAITDGALGAHYLHYGGAGLARYYWETYVALGDPTLELRL